MTANNTNWGMLVNLAKKDDQGAIATLYEMTRKKYMAICRQIMYKTRTTGDMEDVLQDSYVKIFTSLQSLDKPEAFVSWGARIVTNTALDAMRRMAPVLIPDERDLEASDYNPGRVDLRISASPEQYMDRQETSRLVNEMIASLSEEQRLCIYLYYIQDMSVKDIARQAGVSENTVKSRLKYGRAGIEKKVRLLEKQGTKLYGLAPLPFFLWLYSRSLMRAEAMEVVSPACAQAVMAKAHRAAVARYSGSGNAAGRQPVQGNLRQNPTGAGMHVAAGAAVKAGLHPVWKICVGLLLSVGVIGVGLGGYIALNHSQKTDSPPPDVIIEASTEDRTEAETPPPIEILTQETEAAAAEPATETATEAVTDAATETEAENAEDPVDRAMSAAGYEYIGNTQYAVIYQGGSINTQNVGLNIETPTGVVSYDIYDYDGDGAEELLLIILEPSERLVSSGARSAQLAFWMYEKQEDEWVFSRRSAAAGQGGQVFGYFSEAVPDFKVYRVPADIGCRLVVKEDMENTIIADPLEPLMAEAVYGPDEFSFASFGPGWEGYTEESQYYENLNSRIGEPDAVYICRVFVPEVFDEDGTGVHRELIISLMQGNSIDATLKYDDLLHPDRHS